MCFLPVFFVSEPISNLGQLKPLPRCLMWCHTSCPGNFIGLALPAYVTIAPIAVCLCVGCSSPCHRWEMNPPHVLMSHQLWPHVQTRTKRFGQGQIGWQMWEQIVQWRAKKSNTGRRNKKDARKTAEKEKKKRETKRRGAVAMATSRGVRVCGCHGNGQPLTLRSLCTISCWWIWLTLSKIWLMQWLRRERTKREIRVSSGPSEQNPHMMSTPLTAEPKKKKKTLFHLNKRVICFSKRFSRKTME